MRRALAEVSAQLEFNLDGQVWALDLISVMRGAVLSEEGPVSGGRMANVLSAFLDALERLRAAKADVVEAARAATPVIESAIR